MERDEPPEEPPKKIRRKQERERSPEMEVVPPNSEVDQEEAIPEQILQEEMESLLEEPQAEEVVAEDTEKPAKRRKTVTAESTFQVMAPAAKKKKPVIKTDSGTKAARVIPRRKRASEGEVASSSKWTKAVSSPAKYKEKKSAKDGSEAKQRIPKTAVRSEEPANEPIPVKVALDDARRQSVLGMIQKHWRIHCFL